MTRSASATVGASWSPLNVSPLHLWQSDGPKMLSQNYANDGDIGLWPDEVATTIDSDATQDTASAMPHYKTTSELHGAPSLFFRGQTGPPDHAKLDAVVTTTAQPVTIAGVWSWEGSNTAEQCVFRPSATLGSNSAELILDREDGTYRLRVGAGSTVFGTDPGTDPVFCLAFYNGASSEIEINGASFLTGDPGTTQMNQYWSFGRPQDNGRSFHGRIWHLLAYDGDLRLHANFADYEQWIEDHYGIAVA